MTGSPRLASSGDSVLQSLAPCRWQLRMPIRVDQRRETELTPQSGRRKEHWARHPSHFFPVYATRQTVPEPSSVTISDPSLATATPTGRPQTLPSLVTKPDEEVLVFAGRLAVLHRHADDLVAGAAGPVPRAVLGGEGVVAVLLRELVAVVERHVERGRCATAGARRGRSPCPSARGASPCAAGPGSGRCSTRASRRSRPPRRA